MIWTGSPTWADLALRLAGDPDRLRYADAALLAVLLYSCRANSWFPGPGLMSKAARSRRTRVPRCGLEVASQFRGFRVENLCRVTYGR